MALATSLSRESLARCSRIQLCDKRCAELLSDSPSLLGALAIDRSLDLKQSVEPLDRLQGQRRNRRRCFALRRSAGILGDIRQDEERATCVDPTRGFQNGSGLAIGLVQLVVAAVGVGLEYPRVTGEVGLWTFGGAVSRVVEHRHRRCGAAEWAIVAQVNPTSPRGSLALCQDGHSGVVAVQPFGREDMGFHAPQQRLEHGAAGAHMVGQGRQAERHAFPGIALGLAIKRLMLAELFEQDHRQQAGSHQTAGDHMERRRGFG